MIYYLLKELLYLVFLPECRLKSKDHISVIILLNIN